MLFSAHVFDGSLGSTLRQPEPAASGLLAARTATCAPFDHKWVALPQFGRQTLLACWEDETSLTRFLDEDPYGREVAEGWHVRMERVRAVGVFPGLAAEHDVVEGQPAKGYTGPSVAITIGTAYARTFPAFFRVNKGLERQFLDTPSGLWGTGVANLRTRLVATLTVWESLGAARAYMRDGAHGQAMLDHYDPATDPTGHTFVTAGGFHGFRPLSVHGSVDGRNAVGESLLASLR